MRKKTVSFFLIVFMLMVQILIPITTKPISFAYDVIQMSERLKSHYLYDESGARAYLESQLQENYTTFDEKVANIGILKDLGKLVYTSKNDDYYGYSGFDEYQKGEDGQWHYMYLGYQIDGRTKVTNPLFPNVTGSTDFFKTYSKKKWVKFGEEDTWLNVNSDKIIEYMLRTDGIAVQDGGVLIKDSDRGKSLSVQDVIGGSKSVEELKSFTAHQTTPTLKLSGSLKIIHELFNSKRYWRTINIPAVPFALPQLKIEPEKDAITYAKNEQTKDIKATATIYFDGFQPFSGWLLSNYIKEADIIINGEKMKAYPSGDTLVAEFVFKDVPRTNFVAGEWDEFEYSGKALIYATETFGDQFTCVQTTKSDVIVEAGEVVPAFEIKIGEEIYTDGEYEYVDEIGTVTLRAIPNNKVFGMNEISDVLWTLNGTPVSEFKYGNKEVQFTVDKYKLKSHTDNGLATISMTVKTTQPFDYGSAKGVTSATVTHTTNFVKVEKVEPKPPENSPPRAIIRAPKEVRKGDEFTLKANKSYDIDGEIVDYDFNAMAIREIEKLNPEGSKINAVIMNESASKVRVVVTDNDGLTDEDEDEVIVLPALEAKMKFLGSRIEKRKLILSAEETQYSDYFKPDKEKGFTWTITPREGQSTSGIKYELDNKGVQVPVFIEEPGIYNITLNVYAQCSLFGDEDDYESITITQPIRIQKNTPPVAQMHSMTMALRDPADGNLAQIEFVDTSYDVDGDSVVVEYYVAFDENNNGTTSDDSYEPVGTGQLLEIIKRSHVGTYDFYNVATESIPKNQVIEKFWKDEYNLSDDSKDTPVEYRRCTVENRAPIITTSVELDKEVELLVITDEDGQNYTQLLSEVNKLDKDMNDKKIKLNHNIVNFYSDTHEKVSVGMKKEQTFNWHRYWRLKYEWAHYWYEHYSGYEKHSSPAYQSRLGVADTMQGTIAEMAKFPTYPNAYGTVTYNGSKYETNHGNTNVEYSYTQADFYNEPSDYLMSTALQENQGMDVYYNGSTLNYWYTNSSNYAQHPSSWGNTFVPRKVTATLDSGWSQGSMVSESEVSYDVLKLDEFIDVYSENENDKFVIFAIANGSNFFITDDVKNKLDSYGFKVYFSVDEFWGEFSPKAPEIIDVKFKDNALYGKTEYGNQVKIHSNTKIDNVYCQYQRAKDEPVDYSGSFEERLSTLTPNTSNSVKLYRFNYNEDWLGGYSYEESKRYAITDPDGKVDVDYIDSDVDYWKRHASYSYQNIASKNIGDTITPYNYSTKRNDPITIASTYGGGGGKTECIVVGTDGKVYFIWNQFNLAVSVNVGDIDKVRYTSIKESVIGNYQRFRFKSGDRYDPSRYYFTTDTYNYSANWPTFIIEDIDGKKAMLKGTYSPSSNGNYYAAWNKIYYFDDYEDITYLEFTREIGNNDNYFVYDSKIGKYISNPAEPLEANISSNPNICDGGAARNAIYRGVSRDGKNYNTTGSKFLIITSDGKLYVNNKHIASGVTQADALVNETTYSTGVNQWYYFENAISYVKNSKLYGYGVTRYGQLGEFTPFLYSHNEILNTPYSLSVANQSKTFASVFDFTSTNPDYRVSNRGDYSALIESFESEYDDYGTTETLLVQVGDAVDLSATIYDAEGDSIYDKRIDVVEVDNEYFDNFEGVWVPPSDFDEPVKVDKPIKMLVAVRAQDNPVGQNDNFSNFRYWNKDNTTVEVIAHRPPIAVCKVALVPQPDGSFNAVVSSLDSYDLDHSKSRSDKGIIESKYYYKKELEATWTEFDGTMNIENGIEYQFALRVKDLENAWSDYDIKKIKIEGDPFVLNASIDPAYPTGVPAGTAITVEADVFSYKGIDSVKAVFDANTFQLNQVSHDGMTRTYSGTFTTATSQPDQDYYDVEVTAYAADGSIRQVPLKVNVNTPVNIQGSITPKVIKKGQVGTLSANTSEYVKAVNATLFYGKAYSRTIPMTKGSTKNGLVTWNASYTFNENATEGQYEVRFDGETTNGQRGSHKATYRFIPNQAPEVAFLNHTPGFVYEGDDVVLNFSLIDPDGGHLDVDVEVYTRSSSSQNSQQGSDAEGSLSLEKAYSEAGVALETNNSTIYQVSVPNAEATDYIIKLVASDPLGEEASTQAQFSAADLSVSGQVKHTQRWNENRIAFNQSKTQTDNAPRTYQHFWPGERFELIAESTQLDENANVTCESMSVEILNRNRIGSLTGNASSLHFWSGDLWDQDMLEWKDTTLTFRFSAHYSNGRVKTDDVEVILDNSEPYWRIHRLY